MIKLIGGICLIIYIYVFSHGTEETKEGKAY